MKIHLLNFLVFLFFIVYNKVVVISSKDSLIVHDYILTGGNYEKDPIV